MIMDILAQIGALTGVTATEAKVVVDAIESGMTVVAALGIIFGGGVSGLVVSAIKKAIMKKAGRKVILAL